MITAPHIVVMGLMGVGKTTTAQALAAARGVAAHDSDTDLQRLFGRTGAQLAGDLGVAELHRMESAVLLGRLADDQPSVISAAASVIEDARCRDAIGRRAEVIVLQAPLDVIQRRIGSGDHRRALPAAELRAIAERRAPLFAEVSQLDLEATRPTVDLVAAALAYLGGEIPAETPPS